MCYRLGLAIPYKSGVFIYAKWKGTELIPAKQFQENHAVHTILWRDCLQNLQNAYISLVHVIFIYSRNYHKQRHYR